MSTRSRIGLMLEDGTIKHSYCHFDGYPHGVGHTLVGHYSEIEKVKELLSFGDMSFLSPKLNPEGEHSFGNPEKDVTVFYGRDRGESDVDSVITSMEWLAKAGSTYSAVSFALGYALEITKSGTNSG